MRERSLWNLNQNGVSSYDTLLKIAAFSSSFVSMLRFILLEVFKCLKKVNSQFMNNFFEVTKYEYCLRDDTSLLQLKVIKLWSANHILSRGAHEECPVWIQIDASVLSCFLLISVTFELKKGQNFFVGRVEPYLICCFMLSYMNWISMFYVVLCVAWLRLVCTAASQDSSARWMCGLAWYNFGPYHVFFSYILHFVLHLTICLLDPKPRLMSFVILCDFE